MSSPHPPILWRIANAVEKLRRTPMPIADVIPLLQDAADEIEKLRAQLAEIAERKRDV